VSAPDPGVTTPEQPPWRTWFSQAVRFGAVGVLNTLVDWGLYYALTRWAGLESLPVLAKGLSYGAGILNSYFWNKYWTFEQRDGSLRSIIPFVIVSLIALGVNAGVLHLGLAVFSIGEFASLILATGVTLLWNFLMSKLVIFRA